jgi:hypothetical protein
MTLPRRAGGTWASALANSGTLPKGSVTSSRMMKDWKKFSVMAMATAFEAIVILNDAGEKTYLAADAVACHKGCKTKYG